MSQSLAAVDVRALFRLAGELRELGNDAAAWRQHLAAELGRLCSARAVVTAELRERSLESQSELAAANAGTCSTATEALISADAGICSAARSSFYSDVIWYDHATEPTLHRLLPLYRSTFVRSRAELSADAAWYGSVLANEQFRVHDCDDFIISMCAVADPSVISSIELFRAWGERGFGDRERLLVQLLHEELERDWQAKGGPGPRLSPRLKQVQQLLAQGLAEKQVADELSVSTHTVHDYVKALYRAHGVRSRGELLATLSRSQPARTRLAALS